MKMRKVVSAMLVAAMATGMVAGCGSSSDSKSDKKDAKGKVYYLNFKPEQDEQWQDLAKEYTKETGVDVTVLTAASGEYEKTLKSEMAKSNAPTLFQVNGPVGLASWKDYCYDLKDADITKELTSDAYELKDGDAVDGIAYVIESYGLITNKTLLEKAGYTIDDIKSFADLKKVAEDITKRKDELGFSAFTSAGMDGSSDWRFKTHLANLPIYYEYKDNKVSNMDKTEFKYAENYKNILDLYMDNSVSEKGLLGSVDVATSMAEFALGKAAMVQNGNWAWSQISKVSGNVVKEENVKFMPIYTGVEGEETQGLCIGTENYMCVNSNASEADQKASLDFLKWVFSSDEGKEMVTNDLQFITPFSTFGDDEISSDPLAQEVVRYMKDDSLTTVPWNFTTFPSQTFKDDYGASLLEYANGNKEWDAVVSDTVDEWASEKEATAE